ncbi:MAG: hypothetical protein J3Q66DRAFT_359567 [Benniella sp.]|nr:MAG: hypothetical protein J3Q66DRAFT_359567 [Benniella sp.]
MILVWLAWPCWRVRSPFLGQPIRERPCLFFVVAHNLICFPGPTAAGLSRHPTMMSASNICCLRKAAWHLPPGIAFLSLRPFASRA